MKDFTDKRKINHLINELMDTSINKEGKINKKLND